MSERIRNLYRNYAILLVQTSSSTNSALSD